ncbi:MAG: hypothetical protein ABEL76_17315, partial [Bradymonadaceae bacterium]
MSNEETDDELVELLYEEELDPERAEELREAIDADSELRDELEANERLLERVRAEFPTASVDDDLHDELVATARPSNAAPDAGADEDDADADDGEVVEPGFW